MPAPVGYFQTSYADDLTIRKSKFQKYRLVALILAVALVPMVLSPNLVNIAIAIAIAIPGAIALSLLTGVAGQISLGNAAFMGVGATTAALGGAQLGLPFLVVVPLAGAVAGLIGALVGVPSLRVRGIYLIIATFALHFIIVFAIRRIQSKEVGEAGFVMPVPEIGPLVLATPMQWYFVLMGFAILTVFIHVNLVRGRSGRAWLAIRERDIAAEILGVNVASYKIKVFILSSIIIGIQGALNAYFIGVVNYETFNVNLAISYVAMIILGGLGSPVGAIYGAIFVTGLPYLLTAIFEAFPPAVADALERSFFQLQSGIYGVIMIAFLLFEPRGIVALTGRLRKYFALWPFSRERGATP